MNTLALSFPLTGLFVLIIGRVVCFSTWTKNKAPRLPISLFASLLIGAATSTYNLYLAITDQELVISSIATLATSSIFSGVFFFFAFTHKKTPIGNTTIIEA